MSRGLTFEEHAEKRTINVALAEFVPKYEVFFADFNLDLSELRPVGVLDGGSCGTWI